MKFHQCYQIWQAMAKNCKTTSSKSVCNSENLIMHLLKLLRFLKNVKKYQVVNITISNFWNIDNLFLGETEFLTILVPEIQFLFGLYWSPRSSFKLLFFFFFVTSVYYVWENFIFKLSYFGYLTLVYTFSLRNFFLVMNLSFFYFLFLSVFKISL